jgi:hypothetical protein
MMLEYKRKNLVTKKALIIEFISLPTTGIPITFIKKPEPKKSTTTSAMPTLAASAKEVDTEGRSFLPSCSPCHLNDNHKMKTPIR